MERVLERPWYRHYDPGVQPHLDYPDLTLPGLFYQAADRFPDRVATIFRGRRLRYGELRRQVLAFAAGLREKGVRPGERVALMLPNLPQYVVAFFGALEAGAIVVPTNPLYTPHELEHQLNDSGATAIITLDQLFDTVQRALMRTRIRLVVAADIGNALPRRLRPLYVLKRQRQGIHPVRRAGIVCRFADLLASVPARRSAGDPDALAVLQYTGGTTGLSKGAMLTHRNLVANALQARDWHARESGEEVRILCVAPFFHVYGLTIGMNLAVSLGGAMVLAPRFSPTEVAHLARKYRPQLFPGVPTMYTALAAVPGISDEQLGSLEVCISGAAALPAEVHRRFGEITRARLVEGYGLTEASPVTHCNPLRNPRPGTIGVPFPDTDAKITDPETWEDLPTGVIGELTVRGPQVMQGYWNVPDETASVLRDGWLHTGDMATMDEDGFFRIVERKKDVIVASGYNVYPREVEDVLFSHPKVHEVAVIGVPDPYRGETVKAVIVLREGESATAEEIVEYCRGELAAFKVPKIVEFREELPKSLIGKVLRRRLREDADGSLGVA